MEAFDVLGLESAGSSEARPEARARRTALLYFERRRSQVASELRRLKRPRKRYADLHLAAALGRTESRCLGKPGQSRSPSSADGCLMASLKLQVIEAEQSLVKMERWLSPETRMKAEAEADERYRAISAEVENRLELDGLLTAFVVEPAPEPAATRKCAAITRKGAPCRNRAKADGLCGVHARMDAEIAIDELREVAADAVTATTPSLPELDVAALRERLRNLNLVAMRGRLPSFDPVALSKRLPAVDLAALRGRLQSLDGSALRGRLRRTDSEGVDSGVAWAVGGSAALVVAFALIWSGLSGNGNGAPGPAVTVTPAALAPTQGWTSLSRPEPAGSVLARAESRDPAAARDRSGADASPTSGGGGESVAQDSAAAPESAPTTETAPAPAPAPPSEPAPAPEPPAPTPAPEPGGGGTAPPPDPGSSLPEQVGDAVGGITQTANDLVDALPRNDAVEALPTL